MKTYIAQLSMGHDQCALKDLISLTRSIHLNLQLYFTREYTEHGCSMGTVTLSYVTIRA